MTYLVVIAAFVLLLLLEILLRIRMLRFSPWKVKLAYSLFLMGRRRLTENNVINQRVVRGGFRSEAELFDHYSRISGKPPEEILHKFGREGGLGALLSREYYSGGHAVFERALRMHSGIVAKPNQTLQTLEIDGDGFRRTGWDEDPEQIRDGDRVCLLLGGSTAFGLGATSDDATIAGRLGHYLNEGSKVRYVVVNNAMLAYNSHQELVALLQSKYRPDYVIALSGYNELLQFADVHDKVAVSAREGEREMVESSGRAFWTIVGNLLSRSVLWAELRRFMVAFCELENTAPGSTDPDANIYPMR